MNTVVLITGANGMLARSLAKSLGSKYTVRFLTREVTRHNEFKWDIGLKYIDPEALKGVNHIIHLAGSSVAEKRWTLNRKREIYSSRVDSATLILDELQKNNQTIDSFISASAIGYYGSKTTNDILTEESENGGDYLGEVCKDWESVAHSFKSNHVAHKTSILRLGIVLENNAGVLKKMTPPVMWGLGAGIGTGKQWVPWIHIHDLCEMMEFLLESDVEGTYNAVAPEHVTNQSFTRELATVLKRKILLPNIPPLFFKLVFGEMAVVLLTGSRVSSDKIMSRGYDFKYANLHAALGNILAPKNQIEINR
tara:strand:- start:84 stop:1010 length:927 start_codon:yes stop_codon:yes gene_type:complete